MMRPHVSCALAALIVATISPVVLSQEKIPFHEWQFSAKTTNGNVVQPRQGKLPATIVGPVQFSVEKPQALLFSGNAKERHHVEITNDLAQANLPKRVLSAEAWVKVDAVTDWCGLVGALQDNGNYERGWLLGFEKSNFFFALSSQKTQRLTYLKAKTAYVSGYWYHVVGTYDGKTQCLFVDGKLVASSEAQQGDIDYPPQTVYCIGAYRDANEFYPLHGEVESIAVWDIALSAKEVATRFQASKSRFPIEEATTQVVRDWPTHLHDNERSGMSSEKMPTQLHLQWVYEATHGPMPAWPPPAMQDFWNKRFGLKARVNYDFAYPIVTVGEHIYYSSSSEDMVVCLHRDSGNVVWQFYAEGPVRLAPTVADDRVLFGCDDGFVYCVKTINGDLIWKTRLAPKDHRIAGNERVISLWPIRSGVLVENNLAFCCAGFFPEQGVYQAALDITNGEIKAKNQISIPAQGYLARRGEKLFVATGRDPAGAFIGKLTRRGKGKDIAAASIPKEYPYAFIGSENIRYAGGDNKVAAFAADDGRLLWSLPVDGKAFFLAVARGQLYVSTDTGKIYCFGGKKVEPSRVQAPKSDIALSRESADLARQILEKSGVSRGYGLVFNGNADLATQLIKSSRLNLVMAANSTEEALSLRKKLQERGIASERVTVHCLGEKTLPYTDYLFNLVVNANPERKANISEKEMRRVTRPYGGVTMTDPQSLAVFERGPLEGVGEWTHFYGDPGNTACSLDKTVQGPLRMQWYGKPGPRNMIDRHHRTIAPLWKNGRLFVPGNDRVIAVDAYNGTPLWEMEVPESRRIGAFRDSSYLAVGDELVYIAGKNYCLGLDVESGEQKVKIATPASKDGQARDWSYVATVGDVLIGTANKPGSTRRQLGYDAVEEGTYFDARPLVGSEFVFVSDSKSGKLLWRYDSQRGLIINPTLTVGEGSLYFIESANQETLKSKLSRATPQELLSKGANLVSLDLRTGKELWRKAVDLQKIEHIVYLQYSKDKLVVVGSRNSGNNPKVDKVVYDIAVFQAKNGDEVWSTSQKQSTSIHGSHGEQDHHPVIVGTKLFVEPKAYDLHTGKELDNVAWEAGHRRGCGTVSASANTFFFRQSNPTMFDLEENKFRKVTASTRPGCWINMIPAGGLLLVPEASSGCTCNFAVQTSMAFLPVTEK